MVPIRRRAWESRFSRLFRSAEGATAVEYAIMAMLIALAIVVAVTALGVSVSEAFCSALPGLNSACP
jgi:Flp pilus assembly pilin Flp